MREIKFRGKSVKTGIFIFGSLLLINGKAYIHDTDYGYLDDIDFGWGFEEVLIETVGQSTGLLDKQGVEIYEGDILKNRMSKNVNVFIKDGCAICTTLLGEHYLYQIANYCEVIGNIYENSDLLK